MSRTTLTMPILSREPSRLKCPSVARLGISTGGPDRAGTDRDHPVGLLSGSKGPRWATNSMRAASTVEAMMPMRIEPFTLRTCRMSMRNRPKRKTSTGHPWRDPPSPSSSGVPVARRTTLASTNPMRAMNRPIPTLIAVLM